MAAIVAVASEAASQQLGRFMQGSPAAIVENDDDDDDERRARVLAGSSAMKHTHQPNNPPPPVFLQRLYADEQQRRRRQHEEQLRRKRHSSGTDPTNGTLPSASASSSASATTTASTSTGAGSIASLTGQHPPALSYSASSTASSEPTDFLDDFSSSESVASSSFSRSTSPSIKAAFWFQQQQQQQQQQGSSSGSSLTNTPNSAFSSYPSPTLSLPGAGSGSNGYGVSSSGTGIPPQQQQQQYPASYTHPSWSSPSDRQMSPASYNGYGGQPSLQQPFSLPPPSLGLPQSPAITIRSQSTSTLPSSSLIAPASSVSTTSSSSLWTAVSSDENDRSIAPAPSSLARNATLRRQEYSPERTASQEDEEQTLQLPDNFAMVYPGVYRSSFPSRKHYPYLKNLGLKTVLTLVQDEYPQQNLDFFKENGIQFFQIGIPGNKEPFVTIPDEKIRQALAIVLDKRNHPLLIHCNKGKHRTGCLVGCLRKMQCWSSTAIFEEYRKFSFPKSRAMDQLFIELFQPDWTPVDAGHLPDWCLGEDGRTKITESFNMKKKAGACSATRRQSKAVAAVGHAEVAEKTDAVSTDAGTRRVARHDDSVEGAKHDGVVENLRDEKEEEEEQEEPKTDRREEGTGSEDTPRASQDAGP